MPLRALASEDKGNSWYRRSGGTDHWSKARKLLSQAADARGDGIRFPRQRSSLGAQRECQVVEERRYRGCLQGQIVLQALGVALDSFLVVGRQDKHPRCGMKVAQDLARNITRVVAAVSAGRLNSACRATRTITELSNAHAAWAGKGWCCRMSTLQAMS